MVQKRLCEGSWSSKIVKRVGQVPSVPFVFSLLSKKLGKKEKKGQPEICCSAQSSVDQKKLTKSDFFYWDAD